MTRLLKNRARTAVSFALILYCVAIMDFALYPLSTLMWGEVIAAVLCLLAIIALVAHMFESITIPGDEYAYLVTGWAGLTTLLLFWAGVSDHAKSHAVVYVSLFMLTGVFGGYGAYLSQRALDDIDKALTPRG